MRRTLRDLASRVAASAHADLLDGRLGRRLHLRPAGEQGRDVGIGGAELAAAAIELGLVDEFRLFRGPAVVGGGTPFFPPGEQRNDLELIATRTFGDRVVCERYRRRPASNEPGRRA